jgi:hypothetical protein
MNPGLVANTLVRLICFIAELGMIAVPALARDLDGRYKDSHLHGWFQPEASGVYMRIAT